MNKTKDNNFDTLNQYLTELSNINTCLFCGSKNITVEPSRFAPFLEERMFLSKPKKIFAVHCNDCKMIYSSYRPNDEEMTRLYTGYRGEEYQKQRQKHEQSYTKEFNYELGHNPINVISRKKFLNAIIYKHINTKKIKKVLDYGGDSGQFIPDCFSNTAKFVYEVSNVPTIEGVKNISKEEIITNPDFDFVMCCHVLEHVANPIEIIKELISYCKKDGYIYLEVPYEPLYAKNSFIHEHISAFYEETFIKLWDLFDDINVIDARTYMGRTYALIKKQKIIKTVRFFKKSLQKLKLKYRKYLNIYFDLNRKVKILYKLSR